MLCAVTNVGSQEATLTSVDMFTFEGTPILNGNYCGPTLAPRRTCNFTVGGTMPSAFCHVTGSGKLRVALLGYDDGVRVALPGTTK